MSVPYADNINSLAAQVERLEAQARFLADQNAALARECETLRSRNTNQCSTPLAEDLAGIDAKNQQKIRDQAAELTLLLRSKEYLKEQLVSKQERLDELASDLREAKRRILQARNYIRETVNPTAWRIREYLDGS